MRSMVEGHQPHSPMPRKWPGSSARSAASFMSARTAASTTGSRSPDASETDRSRPSPLQIPLASPRGVCMGGAKMADRDLVAEAYVSHCLTLMLSATSLHP
jgi:hypothetical protein